MALCFHYYANIIKAHDYNTPAVLWDIPENEVVELDRFEGVDKHYIKEEYTLIPEPELNEEEMVALVGADNVHIAGNDWYSTSGIIGIAYIMTDWKKTESKDHDKPPRIDYVKHILTGYKEQEFDKNIQYLQDLLDALYRGEDPPE